MIHKLHPIIKIKVHHASYTSPDYSEIIKFLNNGINPTIAKGYGQGGGFYVWTSVEKAFQHIEFQKKRHRDYKEDSLSFVVSFTAHINATEWDLDYEASDKLINSFIILHWDKISSIPDGLLNFEGEKIIFSESEIVDSYNLLKSPGFQYIRIKTEKNQYDLMAKGGDADTDTAAITGIIFNYMQKKHPKLTQHWENMLFKRFAKKGIAIKYVGTKPIRDFDIQLLDGNKLLSSKETIKRVKEKLKNA